MGLPKIPDAKEIAAMTAAAMQPMMDQLEMIHDTLERILDVQEAIARGQAVTLPVDRRKLKSTG